ncbi:MAG: flagellar basal body P-ring protein FlgI [Phycisphaerae bacterium]|jgi:flagellar P-ring protein precursor FlgI
MKTARTIHVALLFASLQASALAQAPTARVSDVTRLQGQGINVLMGYGLVSGLNKTGDGAKFLPTMQALAAMMERFGVGIESFEDIQSTKNIAIVMVEAVIPAHGAREGDVIDVSVTAVAAKSLHGGRLLPTPLVYHDRNVEGLFGFAQGSIEVSESSPTSGIIRKGARVEQDVFINVLATGRELASVGILNPWIQPDERYVTLVLDDNHAGWSMAAAVAQAVDKELNLSADVERVALAVDSKNVVVLVPRHQLGDAASWIRDIERTPILMESNEARVTINRNAGTIVITGDTRLSPVIISQRGMTITVANPLPDGSQPTATYEQHEFMALDNASSRLPNVKDLLETLNQLKVGFTDRVSILEEIHRAGKLHAQIVYEG